MPDHLINLYDRSTKAIVRSSGCWLYDSDGRHYLDFEAGVWCTVLGHSHPRITACINRKAAISLHNGYRFLSQEASDLSCALQQRIGFTSGASTFLSSGSEAINLAISIALHLTGRSRILAFERSYLSAYGHGGLDPDNRTRQQFPDSVSPDVVDLGEVAAVVLETGAASQGGLHFPEHERVCRLLTRARAAGCLVIADEVTTGMGRTGLWFGFQHYKVAPDMVVTGKGLGNGYPVSGVTISTDVVHLMANKPFRYAQSHQDDPLGCAIGREVIATIAEENLVERSASMGAYFLGQLHQLMTSHDEAIVDVRGRGLLIAIELSERLDSSAINRNLFEAGFIVGHRPGILRFLPPFSVEKCHIDDVITRIHDVLNRRKADR